MHILWITRIEHNRVENRRGQNAKTHCTPIYGDGKIPEQCMVEFTNQGSPIQLKYLLFVTVNYVCMYVLFRVVLCTDGTVYQKFSLEWTSP